MVHANIRSGSGADRQTAERHRADIFRLTPIASAVLSCLISGQVAAQTPAEAPVKMDTVVVTGSLIRGTAPAGSSVIQVDRETIEKSGVNTTDEILRQVPQIVNLGTDEGHTNGVQNANANITFGTGINLRGLGAESTLTIMNGRRLVPNGSMGQFVDASMIPSLAIKSIEVVADGASATYGSDAVGGVVNIHLRDHYNGAQTELKYSTGKDISGWDFGQLWGKVWDSGDLMLTYEHYERSNLLASNRKFYTDDMRPWGGPDLRSFSANPGNILIGTTRYAIPAGQNGVGLTAAKFTANTANLQSAYAGAFDALPEQTRDSLVFNFNQKVSDRVSLFGDGYYAKRDYVRNSTAQAPNLSVPKTNPFYVCPATCGATVPVTYSFLADLGNAHATGYEKVFNGTLGANIDLGAEWKGTVFTSYGENRDFRLVQNNINNAQLTAALADPNPATALDPFGAGSNTNPATLDKIRAVSMINAQSKMSDSAVTADGPIASLPGGKVRLAVGAEYQDQRLANQVTGSTTTPNNSTISLVSSGDVHRTVQSAFVEGYLPFVGAANAMPGIQQLNMSLATRFDQYSDFGNTSNPKVGVTWVPVGGLKLRSTYGTSFRAPSLADADPSSGGTVSLVNFVDPTSPTGITRGLYRQGGNAGLQPEKATTWTLGLELKPGILPGSLFSANYFDIDYKNRIQAPANLNANSLLQPVTLAPFINRTPSAADITALYGSPFFTGIPDPIANVKVIVDGRKQNSGIAKAQGLDLTARYSFNNSWGDWDAGVLGSYFFNFRQSLVTTAPLVNVVNTINNPLRFTARGDLGVTHEQFAARLAINYSNSYVNNVVAGNPTVGAYTTADLLLSYDVKKETVRMFGQGLKLSLSVQNIFDRQPPYVLNNNLAFDPQVVSAIGRYATIGLSSKW